MAHGLWCLHKLILLEGEIHKIVSKMESNNFKTIQLWNEHQRSNLIHYNPIGMIQPSTHSEICFDLSSFIHKDYFT